MVTVLAVGVLVAALAQMAFGASCAWAAVQLVGEGRGDEARAGVTLAMLSLVSTALTLALFVALRRWS